MLEQEPEVLLFIVDAGGGHRAAASALIAAAEQRELPARLRVVSLQDVLARVDPVRPLTGQPLEQYYNEMVRRRRTRLLVPLLRVLQWSIRGLRRPLARLVATDLARYRPRLVISLCPNFNGVLADAVRMAHPGVPFVVALTDYADFPPHFWMEPGLDAVVVASDEAERQAEALGIRDVTRTSGMILHPRFYPAPGPECRRAVRFELGFAESDLVVLLLFGGKGSPEMLPLAERLLETGADRRVIAVCGDNPVLFARMEPLAARAGRRLRAFGFTDRVSELLAAADVLATKPGPGSLAEALHIGVPVIVPCNAHTIPQERYNARMVEERGFGLRVRDWRAIPAAVDALAGDPPRRQRLRQVLAAQSPNRAVYELIEMIAQRIGARIDRDVAAQRSSVR